MAAERRRTVKVRSERTKNKEEHVGIFCVCHRYERGFRNFLIDNVEDTTNGRMMLVWFWIRVFKCMRNSKCTKIFTICMQDNV